ncbi:hypothetical protein CDIK_0553 [Cucumispora dikerogammari]|nr:hypothetical protein CDIK_0553 [Cucumispora dikerogammari]
MRDFLIGFLICILIMQHDPLCQLLSLHCLQSYVYLKRRVTNLTIQKKLVHILLTSIGLSIIEYGLLRYLNIRFNNISKIGVLILSIATVLIQTNICLSTNLLVLLLYLVGHSLYLNSFVSLIIIIYRVFNYNLETNLHIKHK